MRIPTVLGLILLLTIFFLALMLHINNKTQLEKNALEFSPLNIRFVNQSPNSLTIIWQSQKPTIGQVAWGQTQSLGNLSIDDRDTNSAIPRYTHYVTIKDLPEDKTIFFKVRNGPFFYPTLPLQTKTSPKIASNTRQPITGKILDLDGQPTDEALIILEIAGSAPIATYSSNAGNFVLPLSDLKNQNLQSPTRLDDITPANLLVTQGTLQSRIKLNISKEDTNLLPIVLGQDQDLTSP